MDLNMTRTTAPLSALAFNPAINPRHSDDGDVSDLLAQMRVNGFRGALWVRPGANGGFDIIDGSRRRRALLQLAAETGTPPDQVEVPVDVFAADDQQAQELALAANVVRSDLSPADEAQAFHRLRLSGMTEAQIAAHFAVPPRRVAQRLALGQLPAEILDALRAGRIDLQTAQAFTISTSRQRQLEVFGDGRNLYAGTVRRQLTQVAVSGDDMRVNFVGVDAYRAAGGTLDEDLFHDDLYLHDEALLQRLFDEKLDATVKALKDEGWSFVKIIKGNDAYATDYTHPPVKPRGRKEQTEEEKAWIASLVEEMEAKEAVIADIDARNGTEDDDLPDEDALRYELAEGAISSLKSKIDALQAPPWTDKQKASTGALVVFRHTDVKILRGRAASRKGQPQPAAGEDPDADAALPPVPAEEPVAASYSDAVEQALVGVARNATKLAMATAVPNLAVRLGLAARVCAVLLGIPHMAPFIAPGRHGEPGPALAARVEQQKALFDGCETFADVLARLEVLAPEDMVMLEPTIIALLFDVQALRNTDAGFVIQQVDANMAGEGFAVDEAFLARLSRDQIALITAEINPDAPVAKGKKPDMVAAALPLIQSSGWLPPQLRTPSYAGPGSASWAPPQPAQQEAA